MAANPSWGILKRLIGGRAVEAVDYLLLDAKAAGTALREIQRLANMPSQIRAGFHAYERKKRGPATGNDKTMANRQKSALENIAKTIGWLRRELRKNPNFVSSKGKKDFEILLPLPWWQHE